MKQEMMGWQWHQLDLMQIICTSLQTDNHTIHTYIKALLKDDRTHQVYNKNEKEMFISQ